MKKYIFILGRDFELSLLELVSFFNKKPIEYTKEIAIFELENIGSEIIKKLGGCLKIGEVIDLENIELKNKIRYGISSYNPELDIKKMLKKRFKEERIKSVLVKNVMPSRAKNLDLEIICYKDYIAKVIAVFNPSEYKFRDNNRPVNDFIKSISIRLAKILINLSRNRGTLLDPFCGVGVLLQEAVLMDYSVIGVDLDNKSIQACNRNLKWIKDNYKIKSNFRVIKGNAKRIDFVGKVDSIVTEPYLGPYLRGKLNVNQVNKIINDLCILYSDFMKSSRKILKSKMVIIIPKFRVGKKEMGFDFDKIIQENKFKICNIFEDIKLPVRYADENKKIVREIYVLE